MEFDSTGEIGEADIPTMSITVEPGAVVCGHRLEALLGKGGFGSVYRATDLSLERQVAFKILDRTGGDVLARFRDEAKLLARLDDPHIIRVHRIGQLPSGESFISMELFGDGSLDDRIERGRRMPVEEAAPIIKQMLAGLQTAHAAGIVHRDIKEANVLIDSSTGHAKICDFGIARAAEGVRDVKTDGVILGTPYYLAPERFRGIGDDPRSDIYAVGVVFYRLLTGQRPFETPGASPLVIARKAATEDVPVPANVPRAVARVCVQMLHRDADLRYPSAAAALQALEDALVSEPTASDLLPLPGMPDRPAPPTPSAGRRTAILIGAAVVSVLAVWAVTRLIPSDTPIKPPDAPLTNAPLTDAPVSISTAQPAAVPVSAPSEPVIRVVRVHPPSAAPSVKASIKTAPIKKTLKKATAKTAPIKKGTAKKPPTKTAPRKPRPARRPPPSKPRVTASTRPARPAAPVTQPAAPVTRSATPDEVMGGFDNE